MRKVLIVVLIILLLNANLLEAAIDVGVPAVAMISYFSTNFTIVEKQNPANATGTIDYIEVYFFLPGTIDVASFEEVSANTFTTRGTALGLSVPAGFHDFDAPGDFTAFDINTGDYIGLYEYDNAKIRYDLFGVGIWAVTGDKIPCSGEAITSYDNYEIPLYGTGIEAGPPPSVGVQSQILMLK